MRVAIDYLPYQLGCKSYAVVSSEPLPEVYDNQSHLSFHQIPSLRIVFQCAERTNETLVHRSGELGERWCWLIFAEQIKPQL